MKKYKVEKVWLKQNYKELKSDFNMVFDDYDKWGSTMSCWFAIAGELNERSPELIPEHWEYRPSPFGGKDPNDYWTEILETYPTKNLVKFGNVLCRYASLLEHAGQSY